MRLVTPSPGSYFVSHWLGVTLLLLLFAGCGSSPPPKSIPATTPRPPSQTSPRSSAPHQKKSAPYTVKGKRYHPIASSSGFAQRGLASWYGRKFHGRLTANGERYNMYARTAAHKILPFNTYLKVTNLSNGRHTLVRVNDRGPFVRGRIIDLTYTAARDLGMVEEGVVPVRIEALGYARKKRQGGKWVQVYVQPGSYQLGDFTIQVGAFANRENARRLHASLNRKYGGATVKVFNDGRQNLYRVRVGRYTRLKRAEAALNRLHKDGYTSAIVVARDK